MNSVSDSNSGSIMADPEDLDEFNRLQLTRCPSRDNRDREDSTSDSSTQDSDWNDPDSRSRHSRQHPPIALTDQDHPMEDPDAPPDIHQIPDLTTDSGTASGQTTTTTTQSNNSPTSPNPPNHPTPEIERTAENGWIAIRERPLRPYDQDADPAGLYGGREVDGRPDLMEFYHRDARAEQNFATMAPSEVEMRERAQRAAETAARKARCQFDEHGRLMKEPLPTIEEVRGRAVRWKNLHPVDSAAPRKTDASMEASDAAKLRDLVAAGEVEQIPFSEVTLEAKRKAKVEKIGLTQRRPQQDSGRMVLQSPIGYLLRKSLS